MASRTDLPAGEHAETEEFPAMLTIHKALITTFAALALGAVVPMSAQATPLVATHAIGRPDSAVEQARAGRGGGGYRGGA